MNTTMTDFEIKSPNDNGPCIIGVAEYSVNPNSGAENVDFMDIEGFPEYDELPMRFMITENMDNDNNTYRQYGVISTVNNHYMAKAAGEMLLDLEIVFDAWKAEGFKERDELDELIVERPAEIWEGRW